MKHLICAFSILSLLTSNSYCSYIDSTDTDSIAVGGSDTESYFDTPTTTRKFPKFSQDDLCLNRNKYDEKIFDRPKNGKNSRSVSFSGFKTKNPTKVKTHRIRRRTQRVNY